MKATAFFSAPSIVAKRCNVFHVGFGVFLALNMLFFWSTLPFASGAWHAEVSEAYLGTYRYASAFSIAIFAFFGIFLEKRYAAVLSGKIVICLLAVAFLLGAVLVGYGSSQADPAVEFLISGLLMGFSNAGFFLIWGKVIAHNPPEISRSVLFFSSVVAALSYLLFVLSPNVEATYLAVGVMLPVMVLALIRSIAGVPAQDIAPRTDRLIPSDRLGALASAWKTLWIPVFCNSALGFSFNLIREISFTAVDQFPLINLLSTSSLILAVIVFLLLGNRLIKEPYIRRFYPVVFLVLSASLFLMPFLAGSYQIVLMTLVSGAYFLVDFLLKVLLLQTSYRTRTDAFFTFGLSHAILFFMLACGTLLGSLLQDNGSYGFVQLVVVAFVCTYLLAIPFIGGGKQSEKVVIAPLGEDGLARRCSELERIYRLTPKETEIMNLMAQGLSFAEMAAYLVVSENTVRTHAKSIYRKLGIHSKPELREIVGNVDIG